MSTIEERAEAIAHDYAHHACVDGAAEAITSLCREVEREAVERCEQAVRASCGPCSGAGFTTATHWVQIGETESGDPIGEPQMEKVECEYCGRPIAAMRAALEAGR